MDWALTDSIWNFTSNEGQSYWHIKWQLGEVSNAELIRSRVFDTTIGRNDNKLVLKWFVSVRFKPDSIELFVNQTAPVIPIAAMARFAVTNEKKDTMYTDSVFHAFNSRWTTAEVSISPSAAGGPIGKGAIIHCWLDLPSAVQHSSELETRKRKWDVFFHGNERRFGPEDVLVDMRYLFWSVLEEDFGDDDHETFNSLSDITLIASDENGKKGRFFCHRVILAARSPVFLRMFANKEWKENANQSEERVVVIEDIDERTMNDVLKYIYSGELVENFECSEEDGLYKGIYAAEKYELYRLKEYLEAKLIRSFSSDNSRIKQLEVAEMYNLKRLRTVCIATLSTNVAKLITVQEEGDRAVAETFLPKVVAMSAKRQLETNQILTATRMD